MRLPWWAQDSRAVCNRRLKKNSHGFSFRVSPSTPLTLRLLWSQPSSSVCVFVCVFCLRVLYVHTHLTPPSLHLLCALWLSSSYLCQIKRKVRLAAPLSWKQTRMFFRRRLTESLLCSRKWAQNFLFYVRWKPLCPADKVWQVILKMGINKLFVHNGSS